MSASSSASPIASPSKEVLKDRLKVIHVYICAATRIGPSIAKMIKNILLICSLERILLG